VTGVELEVLRATALLRGSVDAREIHGSVDEADVAKGLCARTPAARRISRATAAGAVTGQPTNGRS
jgi:hypothetical protein